MPPLPIIGETKHKILLALRKERLHGYRLAKVVDIPVTGIYQHLRELEKEGLVSFQRDGSRKVYLLTSKGDKLLDVLEMNGSQN